MFRDVPPRPTDDPPDLTAALAFDWSARLSIEMIRSHTKTDDTPTIENDQINLYRSTAIEAAEKYTGLLLKGQRTIMEPVQGPASPKPGRATYKHTLRYPVADGIVYLYGSLRKTFRVPVGSRTIHVPVLTGYLDLSNCCNPCSDHHMNAGLMAAYVAGYASPDDVPSSVMLGCLQFIAWAIQHPGDELVTVMDKSRVSSGGVQGTNSIALASGALETWRVLDTGEL